MKLEVVKALGFLKIDKKELEGLIEIPSNSEMGDYAFPCFSLSKKLKKNPAEIAKDLVSKIKENEHFERVEAVGSYLNFFVDRKILAEKTLKEIVKSKDKYGSGKAKKEKVMIEFSQPNTHKAFHVGHVRGTSVGESLARIADFQGNNVVRANYSGDTGKHIAKWLWAYKKYHKNQAPKKEEKWFADIYVEATKKLEDNDKGNEEVEEINRKLDSGEDRDLNALWKKTRKFSIDSWKEVYKELGVKFDVHFFESEVEEKGKEISKELVKKGLAEVSEDAVIMDLKKYNLGVWVLLRKDGTVLYSAKDIALAEKKFNEFKIDKSIYVVGNEQRMHIYQLFKTLELMKFKQAKKCEYVSILEIRFPWGKMSSRSGDNVLYSDFKNNLKNYALKEIQKRDKLEKKELEERALKIAIASMKYVMLKQDNNKNIIFDPKEVIKFEGDTGPYLLYSYARAQSILRKAKTRKKNYENTSNIEDIEKNLVSQLAAFPEIAEKSYRDLSPNHLANYSYELAKKFNEFYHKEKVIGSEDESFKLLLVSCFSQVLKNTLYLLGIEVISEM